MIAIPIDPHLFVFIFLMQNLILGIWSFNVRLWMDKARVHFVQRDPEDGKNGSENVHAPNIINFLAMRPRNQAC
jgi:hypothetical protein